MSFKESYEEGIDILNIIYTQETIDWREEDLRDLYELCSQTEPFSVIAEIMIEARLDPASAIKLYHVLKRNNRW